MARLSYCFLTILLAAGACEVLCLQRQVSAQEKEVRSLRQANESLAGEILDSQNRLCEFLTARLGENETIVRSAARGVDAATHQVAEHGAELRGIIQEESSQVASALQRELSYSKDAITAAIHEAAATTRQSLASRREPRSLKEATIYPTVQLRGNGTVGSGVIVYSRPRAEGGKGDRATTYAVTAYHVVLEVTTEEARDVIGDVRLMGTGDRLQEQSRRAHVVSFDRARDIALLQLAGDEPYPFVAEFAAPEELALVEVFEPAYAVGCPLGNMPLPSAGEITTKQKVVDNQVFWMLNAPTFFGNSGGGVFRARDGKLIGVSSMIYTYGRANPVVVPHLGLFVPASAILEWLDREGFGFIGNQRVPHEVAVSAPEGAGESKTNAAHRALEPAGFQATKEARTQEYPWSGP
jgi:S1-C subfamily serine protease